MQYTENIFFLFFHHVKSFYLSVKYTIVSTRFAKPSKKKKQKTRAKFSCYVAKGTEDKDDVELKNVYFESNTNGFDSRGIHLHKIHALGLCFFIHFVHNFAFNYLNVCRFQSIKKVYVWCCWFMCAYVEYRLLFTENSIWYIMCAVGPMA